MFQHNDGRLVTGDDDKENPRLIVWNTNLPRIESGFDRPRVQHRRGCVERTEDKTMNYKWGKHPIDSARLCAYRNKRKVLSILEQKPTRR